jgi:hypothetical protein
MYPGRRPQSCGENSLDHRAADNGVPVVEEAVELACSGTGKSTEPGVSNRKRDASPVQPRSLGLTVTGVAAPDSLNRPGSGGDFPNTEG